MRAFKGSSRQERPPKPENRSQSSRLPTKAATRESDSKQSKSAQHVSQMGKKTSRSTVSAEKTASAHPSATRTPTLDKAARPPAEGPRRLSTSTAAGGTGEGGTKQPSPYQNIELPRQTSQSPSLAPTMSASPLDSHKSNGLRRKPSTIEQYTARMRSETPKVGYDSTSFSSKDRAIDREADCSMPSLARPTRGYDQPANAASEMPPRSFHDSMLTSRDTASPFIPYAQSVTPSTRYTDSPFSHVPTPSSASSYSSVVVAPNLSTTPRQRQQSPTRDRPPLSGRPTNQVAPTRSGLLPVRESSTSSSNSTVKPSGSRSVVSKKDLPPKPGSAPPGRQASITQRSTPLAKQGTASSIPGAPAAGSKPPVHVPPELAHLIVDAPQKPTQSRVEPPFRPSRDGAPALIGMNAPSPVVQSDLPRLYTSYHKRTPSQETPTSATSPSLKSRFGFSSRSSSRQASPRVDSAVSPPPAAKVFARGLTPDGSNTDAQRLARKDSPAVGPTPSKSPRFGFFSRKSKAETNKPPEKPKRQPSKGPVAGTGHEGYGRFSTRGRSASTSSNADLRSSSTESTTSSQRKRQSTSRKSSSTGKDGLELDDFLRERLTPVVLRGSGSTISNTASSSDAPGPSVPNSSHNSSLDSIPKPTLLPSAIDSAIGVSPVKTTSRSRRAPSDSSEDDVMTRYPVPAGHLYPPSSQADAQLENRIRNMNGMTRPSQDSSVDERDPGHLGRSQVRNMTPSNSSLAARENLPRGSADNGAERKAHRKWNFFQRAQASPRDKGEAKASNAYEHQHNAAHNSPYRGIAHYTMLDPAESVGLEEVEKILQENETSPEDSNSETNVPSRIAPYQQSRTSWQRFTSLSAPPNQSNTRTRAKPPHITIRPGSDDSPELKYAKQAIPHQSPHVVSIQRSPSLAGTKFDNEQKTMTKELKPGMPHSRDVRTPDAPQAPFNTSEDPDGSSPSRQPRLSPIGRIPKVVSKRDRERKLSDSSFSRPFARGQPKPTVKPPGSLYNQIRELASPTDSGSQPVSSTSTNSHGGSSDQNGSADRTIRNPSIHRSSVHAYDSAEFFSFPPRNDSDVSYSSSSGNNSILAMLAKQPPQEDDIWAEYNDLLDDVMPDKAYYSSVSALGMPFNYPPTFYDSPDLLESQEWYSQPPSAHLPAPPRSHTVPAVLSVPQQIARLQPSVSPLTTPQILSEVFSHYGNRSTSTLMTARSASNQDQNRESIPRASQSSIPRLSKAAASGPRRTSVPEPSVTGLPRNSKSSAEASRSSLPRSNRSSNPSVRGSVASSARHSRGSAHSRSASLPEANARNSQSSLTPSARFNRDTQLLDIAEVDGDEQAAAANLRYGALMTSKWLSFGRVLFSPAHNEMRLAHDARVMIVDGLGSDWSYYVAISYPAATVYNLGPAQTNGVSGWPDANEKPPSNHRHINHAAISAAFPFPKGFFTAVVFRFPLATTDQAYQACIHECKRVLRPGGFLEVVALDLDLMNMGNNARKELRGLKTRLQHQRQDVSLRNLSDVLVGLIGRRGFEDIQRCLVGVPAAGHIPKSQDISSTGSGGSGKPIWQREDRQSQEYSFGDLLEDARANQLGEGKTNDDNITKMVAKVGRWWYSTCYERALLRKDSSIWNDTALLRECEKQGTSFRLLICYAQKPAQTRRRTVSV